MYISKIIDIFKGFFLSDATEPITTTGTTIFVVSVPFLTTSSFPVLVHFYTLRTLKMFRKSIKKGYPTVKMYLKGRRRCRRHHKVYIFLFRITSRVN